MPEGFSQRTTYELRARNGSNRAPFTNHRTAINSKPQVSKSESLREILGDEYFAVCGDGVAEGFLGWEQGVVSA